MAAPGPGQGESKKVRITGEGDDPMTGVRTTSETPVRGRGGFRSSELGSTIPSNITQIRATNVANERHVDLLANYVQITPMADKFIHKYRIDYEPAVESASLMRFLFRSAAGASFAKFPIFDGAHECRSSEKLPKDITELTVADAQADNRQYNVKIAHIGSSVYGPEAMRIYNMHMKDFLRTMGFYSPQVGLFVHQDHCSPIGNDIMLLRGFRTSANEHDGHKMLMNLEGAHKLVQRKNCLVQMAEVRGRTANRNALQEALRAEFIGKVVITSYNKRIYRIEDIDFTQRPTSTFDMKGTQVSFVDFYQQQHKKAIADLQQPLFKAVPNNQRKRDEEAQKEILLVPELCNIAGLTTPQRNDNRLKMDLIRASQIPPNDRVNQMRQFLSAFHQNKDIINQLSTWGYNYGTDAVRLRAHVVPPTGIATGRVTTQPMNTWPKANPVSADVQINKLAVAPKIKKMVVITTRTDLRDKGRILGTLEQAFQKVGLEVAGQPLTMDIETGDSARDYIAAIRNVPKDCDVAIVIMHGQNKERYDAIKKAASVERGLITQVVTARLMTDERKARTAALKIAIQIAAKVGGEPWWVDIPLKKVMVCGYDTYHDTAQRGRSFGAFVSSLNVTFSRWWSKADAHDRLEEVSAQVSTNMAAALQQYMRFNNGEKPERVFIYRDGVGEGQLSHVVKTELKMIKQALGPQIKLTFIVVNKRIGARFFCRANQGFENPPPGTVVDHTVTREERYDFYLISQSTRQGTVTPTYYNIIHDESGYAPEIHQKMAFKMCLLYYNWSGTVRVPAPCQYAHKLALLCGEHLHAQPNSNMDDKLHFL